MAGACASCLRPPGSTDGGCLNSHWAQSSHRSHWQRALLGTWTCLSFMCIFWVDQTEKMIVSNLVCLPKGRAETHTLLTEGTGNFRSGLSGEWEMDSNEAATRHLGTLVLWWAPFVSVNVSMLTNHWSGTRGPVYFTTSACDPASGQAQHGSWCAEVYWLQGHLQIERFRRLPSS